MIWASVDGRKVEATPGQKGLCPHCASEVFSKCGEIYVWHWAHQKNQACDSWYEPETYWHKYWKYTFGLDNCERIIRKEGTWHVADVLTKERVVIELQNSPIRNSDIVVREGFYGEKMLWVLNGKHFKNNFHIRGKNRRNSEWYNSVEERKLEESKCHFIWSHARKCWSDSKRPVFIDFGGKTLFWVKEGLGKREGWGIYILKEKFIQKYGGDYEFYKEAMIEEEKRLKAKSDRALIKVQYRRQKRRFSY